MPPTSLSSSGGGVKNKPMKSIIPKESQIQAAVCDYLSLKKRFFWRQNTTPVYDKTGGFFRAMPKYALKGIPDVIVITDGGYVCFLEIKRPKAKLSPDQEVFRDRCTAIGAEYHIITDVTQLKELGL
jgi:hypothetical protein